MAPFLPQLPALSVEVAAARPFTWVVLVETEFKDAFTHLAFYQAPFSFSTLTEEEREFMKAIVGRRSVIRKTSIKVVKLLERIIIILSDIIIMSDGSYNHYLALNGQMAFIIRNFLFHLFV